VCVYRTTFCTKSHLALQKSEGYFICTDLFSIEVAVLTCSSRRSGAQQGFFGLPEHIVGILLGGWRISRIYSRIGKNLRRLGLALA
jgi:hypothetical protein